MVDKVERPKLYTYGGIVVRLYRGKLEPVWVTGPAGRGLAPARRTKYMPLPKPLRRMLATQARKAEQARRFDALNVTMPDPKPGRWTDLSQATAVAS